MRPKEYHPLIEGGGIYGNINNTKFVFQRAKSTDTMIVNDIDGKVEVSDTLFLHASYKVMVHVKDLKVKFRHILKLSVKNKICYCGFHYYN